ncbi:hypothetical protein JTE90_004118 [Oedothorax gibbosus]|uniref:Uncharacterized protein n=1 Tax=Oedothorax gibbosus TaxID=931172 RepID=A0AAV6V3D8_9ARAC|nr:hypothetical protein JTE90_004118 [Oedothorax gibbosus]
MKDTSIKADKSCPDVGMLKNNVSDVSYHVAQYQTIINELRQEIENLHQKIHDSKNTSSVEEKKGGLKDTNKLTDEEMKHLKKQLIESFNSQMDVRRRMMDIDNTLLAQSIEFDKLNMIISEWETEKAVSAIENDNDCDNNEQDHYKADRDQNMPDQVFQALEDLQFVKDEHERYLEMRSDCETDYKNCKHKTYSVTESLSEKASSGEQRELLHLLTRVYELEIEKLELQSSQLSREHALRCRDLMLLRYDRQRQLCDDIITRQRRLIDAMATGEKSKNDNARKELNELYRIYQQEIQDLNNGRNSDIGQLSIHESLYRPSSSGLRPLGSSGSMLELHQLDLNKHSSSSVSKISYPLPPIGLRRGSQDSEHQLFQRRKRQPFRRGSDEESQLPSLPHPMDSRLRRANSRFSNSSSNSSIADRGSVSTSSPQESSTGESIDLNDYPRHKLNKVEEFEEPLKKRYGILPSLRLRKRQGTSSDSEVLVYNRNKRNELNKGNFSDKKIFDIKQEVNEVRRTKQWNSRKGLGY